MGIYFALSSETYGEKRMMRASNMSGINFMQYWPTSVAPEKNGRFDQRQAKIRAITLCLADWLMSEWPKRFIAFLEAPGVDQGDVLSEIGYSYLFEFSINTKQLP